MGTSTTNRELDLILSNGPRQEAGLRRAFQLLGLPQRNLGTPRRRAAALRDIQAAMGVAQTARLGSAARLRSAMASAQTTLDDLAAFDVHVDSVTGDDSNDGRLKTRPKRTLAALGTVGDGLRVGLARGSYWREQITTTSSGVLIGAFGSGKLPTLDAADVIGANWTKTAGRTNIYEFTFTNPEAYVGGFPSLWEDGARLRWINGLDLLDAASGRFYVADTTGATITIYVYPTGGGNPNSNGKIYENAARLFGVNFVGPNCTVREVHARRQLHNDGSIRIAGANGRAHFCVAEDGTKHNLYIAADGVAEDCIAWKTDWSDRIGGVAFIAYIDIGTGHTAVFRRCVVRGDLEKTIAAIADGKTNTGFFAHNTNASVLWDSVTYEDCSVIGMVKGFDAGAQVFNLIRPYSRLCSIAAATNALVTNIIDPNSADASGAVIVMTQALEVFTGVAFVEGLRHYAFASTPKGCVYSGAAGTTINIKKSALYRPSGVSGHCYFLYGNNATAITNSDHNIVHGIGGTTETVWRSTVGSQDFGLYFNSNLNFRLGAVQYDTFAAWRAAQPGYDANSVIADPLLVDPANDDWRLQAASPAIALGMGLERPTISYTVVPTDDQIAAM